MIYLYLAQYIIQRLSLHANCLELLGVRISANVMMNKFGAIT